MKLSAPQEILPRLRQRTAHLLEARQSSVVASARESARLRFLCFPELNPVLLVESRFLVAVLLNPRIHLTPRTHPACLGIVAFRNAYCDAFCATALLHEKTAPFSGHLVLCQVGARIFGLDLGSPGNFEEHPASNFTQVTSSGWPAALDRQLTPSVFVLNPPSLLSHPAFSS